MKILITSGGTKVPIDPVRDITNMSNGTFGSKIATEALKLGHDVFFFTAERGLTPFTINEDILDENRDDVESDVSRLLDFRDQVRKRYRQAKFRNFDHYAEGLPKRLADYEPDIIILAAAVSDYITEPSKTKVKSSEDLDIHLTPAEKVISHVKDWCPNALLVGFKLLVGGRDLDLIQASYQSIRTNRCDLVVANEFFKLKSGNHEIMLVEAYEGESFPVVERFRQNDNPAYQVVKKAIEKREQT